MIERTPETHARCRTRTSNNWSFRFGTKPASLSTALNSIMVSLFSSKTDSLLRIVCALMRHHHIMGSMRVPQKRHDEHQHLWVRGLPLKQRHKKHHDAFHTPARPRCAFTCTERRTSTRILRSITTFSARFSKTCTHGYLRSQNRSPASQSTHSSVTTTRMQHVTVQ